MDAVRLYAAGDLRTEQIGAPAAPPAGWVKVKVGAAGICGSDLHNYHTGQWISRSPSVAGHEFAGLVTEVGPEVDGISVGDHVVADSRVWCGVCPNCRDGRRHVCDRLGFVGEVIDGGFAEETLLPARLAVVCPQNLPWRIAAFAEPLAVALHAIRRLRITPGEPVLVVGCGPIGGLAALLLSRRHDGPVLVADRNAGRASLVAEVVGATRVELAAASVEEALGGRRLRYGLDATGSVGAIDAALDLLAGGSTLGLVGISHGRIDLDPNRLVEREIALVGCHAFADELPEAVALLPGLAGELRRFIDAEIGLADVPAAYERLLRGDSAGLKAIIAIGASDGPA
ncbi:MAG: alcohol dehydrogenase catalytic domain-containing protein [Rhizobiaceae bacterium]|nr:alcohol dehydrogenase catalytic domain-containing protein [Rhizobiaceae bacterium]